jgi:hypothetical protein
MIRVDNPRGHYSTRLYFHFYNIFSEIKISYFYSYV